MNTKVLSYKATKRLKRTKPLNNTVSVFFKKKLRTLYVNSIGEYFIVRETTYYLSDL